MSYFLVIESGDGKYVSPTVRVEGATSVPLFASVDDIVQFFLKCMGYPDLSVLATSMLLAQVRATSIPEADRRECMDMMKELVAVPTPLAGLLCVEINDPIHISLIKQSVVGIPVRTILRNPSVTLGIPKG